ncbi:MAG TPA: TIGR03560 family F420-dependent LLM class oxidoreductase [Thermomicrobiales bacterium]|nr:TIGR03560 family F420-dependent LLM class oxidoreductase [Thermomicrobiales bacterium]
MIELSISVEGVVGLTWPEWKRPVRTVEDIGFAGLYLSDHIVLFFEQPDEPSLELVVALTYLADHTERVRFGPMVSPLSVRDPVMLARQAAALDDLSDGRMVLGVGAGWMEREHTMFGYDLGDIPTRFARLEEGLEVITRLLRSDQPANFEGAFFRLHEAVLPEPRRPNRPPVMIGGSGPRRTLPLAARFADVWNATGVTPEQLTERMALLDDLLEVAGRRPEDVRRTLTVPVVCWRSPEELEARVRWARRFPPWRSLTADQLVEEIRTWQAIVGTPEEVASQIRAYAAAGISEIAMQWYASDDIEGLESLAAEVLPQVAAAGA